MQKSTLVPYLENDREASPALLKSKILNEKETQSTIKVRISEKDLLPATGYFRTFISETEVLVEMIESEF